MFGKRFAYMAYITCILLYSSTFKFTFSNKDEHWVSTILSIVCLRKLHWDFRQSIPSFVSCIVLSNCWSLCWSLRPATFQIRNYLPRDVSSIQKVTDQKIQDLFLKSYSKDILYKNVDILIMCCLKNLNAGI